VCVVSARIVILSDYRPLARCFGLQPLCGGTAPALTPGSFDPVLRTRSYRACARGQIALRLRGLRGILECAGLMVTRVYYRLQIEISKSQRIISENTQAFSALELKEGSREKVMLSKTKCSDYIDTLVQMGILALFVDKKGEERVELKVPLEELLRDGLERSGEKPPEDTRKFPQWISLLLSKTVVTERELIFSREDLIGIASVFMSLICLAYDEDVLTASVRLLRAAEKLGTTAKN